MQYSVKVTCIFQEMSTSGSFSDYEIVEPVTTTSFDTMRIAQRVINDSRGDKGQ